MKKQNQAALITALLLIIICAAGSIVLLRMTGEGGRRKETVTSDMAETEVTVLSDTVFYRDVPAEHMAWDPESGASYVDDEILVRGASYSKIKNYLKEYLPKLAGCNPASGQYEICLNRSMSEKELLDLCESLAGKTDIEGADVNYWMEGTDSSLKDMGKTSEVGSLSAHETDNNKEQGAVYADWGIRSVKADQLWKYGAAMQNPVSVLVWDRFCDRTEHEDIEFESVSGDGYGDENHGMHVAGIIGAAHNDRGILGMAPAAEVTAYNIHSEVGGNAYDPARLTCASVEAEFTDMVVNKGARVINISQSLEEWEAAAAFSPSAQYIMLKINEQMERYLKTLMGEHDFLICKSSGNLNNRACKKAGLFSSKEEKALEYILDSQGSHKLAGRDLTAYSFLGGIHDREIRDRILVVGAYKQTTGGFKISDYSSGGERVDILAPGDDIYSLSSGGGYTVLDGTSMAAPYVAGAAAALYGIDDSLTAAEVKKLLIKGEDWICGNDGNWEPMLDMRASMDALKRRVEGSVTDADSGEPLADVTVDFYYLGTAETEETETDGLLWDPGFTGPDGRFETKLVAGVYRAEFHREGYDPVRTTVTVKENGWKRAESVQMEEVAMKKGYASAYVSSMVQNVNGISYLSQGLNGNSDANRLDPSAAAVGNDVFGFICADGEIYERKVDMSDWRTARIIRKKGDGSRVEVASDASVSDPFVYWDGRIFYFNRERTLMAADVATGSSYSVFRSSDFAISYPAGWNGGCFDVSVCGNGLYFAPTFPKGVVYRMDFESGQVGEYHLPGYDSDYSGTKLQTDGYDIYYLQYVNGEGGTHTLMRESLDGSSSEELFAAVDTNFVLDGNHLYFQKDGVVYRWNTGDSIQKTERLFSTDRDSLLAVSGGRIYFYRFEIYNGIDSVAMYYSVNLEGTDEICYGVYSH